MAGISTGINILAANNFPLKHQLYNWYDFDLNLNSGTGGSSLVLTTDVNLVIPTYYDNNPSTPDPYVQLSHQTSTGSHPYICNALKTFNVNNSLTIWVQHFPDSGRTSFTILGVLNLDIDTGGTVVKNVSTGATITTLGTGWHCFTIARNSSSTYQLSINGNVLTQYTGTTGTEYFRKDASPTTGLYVRIDSMGIWDRLLDSVDVGNLYHSGAPLTYLELSNLIHF